MAVHRELPSIEDVQYYYSAIGETLVPVFAKKYFIENPSEEIEWMKDLDQAVNWTESDLKTYYADAMLELKALMHCEFAGNRMHATQNLIDVMFLPHGSKEHTACLVAHLIEIADLDYERQRKIAESLASNSATLREFHATSAPAKINPSFSEQELAERVDVLGKTIGRWEDIKDEIKQTPQLLNAKGMRGLALIHYACLYGAETTLKGLLKKRAEINLLTSKGETVFDCARFAKKNKQEIKHFLFMNKYK